MEPASVQFSLAVTKQQSLSLLVRMTTIHYIYQMVWYIMIFVKCIKMALAYWAFS